MDINIANNLLDNGIYAELYKAGFISDKLYIYRDIYLWVHAQMQTRKISCNRAVKEAQGKYKCDRRTIWRALHSFSVASAPALNSGKT
jgi:hypothetical protein